MSHDPVDHQEVTAHVIEVLSATQHDDMASVIRLTEQVSLGELPFLLVGLARVGLFYCEQAVGSSDEVDAQLRRVAMHNVTKDS